MSVLVPIKGNCPMGCGSTLFVGEGGHVTCSLKGCPDPCAVDTILADRESEHVVLIGAESFSVQHSLRERINSQLFDCALHQWMSALAGPPRRPGRYRAIAHGKNWRFTQLESDEIR